MSSLFIGSYICKIATSGNIILPTELCTTITTRKSNQELYVVMQEDVNCLLVCDRELLDEKRDHFDRRRLAEGGTLCPDQKARLRRHFGFAAMTKLDGKGQVAIAPWFNARRGEAYRALAIGMGNSVEIWDLDHVLNNETGDLRLLAQLHLRDENAPEISRDRRDGAARPSEPRPLVQVDA